jgi:hypothetical protein
VRELSEAKCRPLALEAPGARRPRHSDHRSTHSDTNCVFWSVSGAIERVGAITSQPVLGGLHHQSDNGVVAAPMNWRAESTGSPLPLSRSATQLAEIMAKVDRPCEFRKPGMRVPPRSCSARVRPHRNCSGTNHFRSLSEHRLGPIADHARAAALELACHKLASWKKRGSQKSRGHLNSTCITRISTGRARSNAMRASPVRT